jgi:formylglycine-generating enzyme required for sulfatase activity
MKLICFFITSMFCLQIHAQITFEFDMVFVEGGRFEMGCTYEQEKDCHDNETPSHQVRLSSYYIGKYEITQAQWEAIMGNNPSIYKGDDLPVTNVSWNDVQAFISKLHTQTGKNYRLPTEAEWEYAARGGKQSNGYKYSGSNIANEVAWYKDNSNGKPHRVGQKKANELDIYDMSGNVLEWCSDWFGMYSDELKINPKGAFSGSGRIVRGGSAPYGVQNVRVSCRGGFTPSFNKRPDIGFRLACSSE